METLRTIAGRIKAEYSHQPEHYDHRVSGSVWIFAPQSWVSSWSKFDRVLWKHTSVFPHNPKMSFNLIAENVLQVPVCVCAYPSVLPVMVWKTCPLWSLPSHRVNRSQLQPHVTSTWLTFHRKTRDAFPIEVHTFKLSELKGSTEDMLMSDVFHRDRRHMSEVVLIFWLVTLLTITVKSEYLKAFMVSN